MTSIQINDSGARAQYTASAAQTNFSYPFEIFEDEDLKVWLTPVGDTPDVTNDLLILNSHYTVTGAGAEGGGDIVLVTPATSSDIITIIRDIPIERLFNYTVGGEFTGLSINQQLDILTMTQQQNESVNETRQLTYNSLDNLTSGDIILPKLAENEIWTKSAAGGLINAEIEESEGYSTLRSELANNQSGTDGSKIVGYHSVSTGSITVHEALSNVVSGVKYYAITAGIANTYTATMTGLDNYETGLTIDLNFNVSNSSSSTININGFGAKLLRKIDKTNFKQNELRADQIYSFVYDGTKFYQLSPLRTSPKEYINGVLLENDSTAPTTSIKFKTGICRDADDTIDIIIPSNIIKNLHNVWVLGSGNGGRPSTVPLAVDTCYHCFVLYDEFGNWDAGFDTDIDATNLLAVTGTYNKYRRAGSCLTQKASTDIELFSMIIVGEQRITYWKTVQLEYSAVVPATTAILTTLRVPKDITPKAIINTYLTSQTLSSGTYFSNSNQTDQQASVSVAPLAQITADSNAAAFAQIEIVTNTNRQIRHRNYARDGNTTLRIATLGYIE